MSDKAGIRAASLLLRDDFHEHQDNIYRTLRDGEWRTDVPRLATHEHVALIAKATKSWDDWQLVSAAWRAMSRVTSLRESDEPLSDNKDRIIKCYEAINAAKPVLAKIDGGPSTPHGMTDEIEGLR